ncbi:MAG: DUF167 domain-containing protein [Alphaproteobacteria bacterium]|nr:DUF167 domain-containing protein [Alphaproteobacteria bacterium]
MVFEQIQQKILLRVRLSPNSSCCKVCGIYTSADDCKWLKINVISVPEKGKANQELIKFLSKELKLAKSAFSIISGELDRYKKILITTNAEHIKSWLKDYYNDSNNS